MSKYAQAVKQAIKKLGSQATFTNIAAELKGTMSLGQVHAAIAGLSQKKIRKDKDGVYQIIRKKRRKARGKPTAKRVTKKKAATRPRKRTDGRRRRRPSLLVRLDEQIRATEQRLNLLRSLRKVAKKDPAAVQETLRSCK